MSDETTQEPEVEIIEVEEKQFQPFDLVIHVKNETQARRLWNSFWDRTPEFFVLNNYMVEHGIKRPVG